MKLKSLKPQIAFSLIELAITIMIIGTLLAVITGSNRLSLAGKLRKAQQLTKNSPVPYIGGNEALVAWFESSLPDSIEKNSDGTVSKWFNLAINNSNHATQTTTANQPIFTQYAINKLPALKFDGSNDFFDMDAILDTNDDYHTIITVWQADDMSIGFVWSQGASTPAQGDGTGMVRYISEGAGWDGYSMGYITQSYNIGEPGITAIIVNDTSSSVTYNDNKTTHTIAAATLNIKTDETRIGRRFGGDYYFKGYIAEIIIYNEVLSDDDIDEINKYLSTKYKIILN